VSDQRTRDLERRASTGDPSAQAAAVRALCRLGHDIEREWLGPEITSGPGERVFFLHAEDFRSRQVRTTTLPGRPPLPFAMARTRIEAEAGSVFCEDRCRRPGCPEKRLIMVPASEQCAAEGHAPGLRGSR
jgi:hypothetical protein